MRMMIRKMLSVASVACIFFTFAEVEAAEITFDRLAGVLRIKSGIATLGEIAKEINDPSVLERVSAGTWLAKPRESMAKILLEQRPMKVWLLKKDIEIGPDATLLVNGVEADELRLCSTNKGKTANINIRGFFWVEGVNIVAWDPKTQKPAPNTDGKRARIVMSGNQSKVRFRVVTFSNLGDKEHKGLLLREDEECVIKGCVVLKMCRFKDVAGVADGVSYGSKSEIIRDKTFTQKNAVGVSGNDVLFCNNTLSGAIHVSSKVQNRNVRVENCVIRNSTWNGMVLNGCVDSIVIGCEVKACPRHNGIQVSAYWDKHPAVNSVVKNCVVAGKKIGDNAYYVTWYDRGWDKAIRNVLIEDCLAHDTNTRGIATQGVANCVVRRFRIWNNKNQNIQFYKSRNCFVVDSVLDLPLKHKIDIEAALVDKATVINTQFTKLRADRAKIGVYYYLDVLVIDENRKPVKGAKVSVVNETDPSCLPINMDIPHPKKRSFAYTLSDGHTPSPANLPNTLAIMDYSIVHQEDSGLKKTDYKYTITVTSPDGKAGKKVVTGIDPDKSWFRIDAEKPTHTITVTIKK